MGIMMFSGLNGHNVVPKAKCSFGQQMDVLPGTLVFLIYLIVDSFLIY